MTTQSMIIIHLPPIIRHQTYFAALGERLKNLGYDITYICLDQDYASYWKKILKHRIISPMRPSSEDIKVPKLTDFINKGNKAHDLPLTDKIILDIQNCQQPHAKFGISQFTELVLSTLRSLDFVMSNANNVLFFNNSCAMDVYNITFTYAASWYDKCAVLMDYSPIEGYEITFSKFIQKDYLKLKSSTRDDQAAKEKAVDRFIRNEQFLDANNAYFETRKKQKKYFRRRALMQYWFMLNRKPLSLLSSIFHFRMKRNIFAIINYFSVTLLSKKIKHDALYDYVFIGSSNLESFQKMVFPSKSFITNIIEFRNRFPEDNILYKPHPASKSEEILFLDLLKLKMNRIDVTFDKVSALSPSNVKCCVGVSSSVLIKSMISCIKTNSLFRGIHGEFGVKKIENLKDLKSVANQDGTNCKSVDANLFFKGKQRYYTNSEVDEVVESTILAIGIEIGGRNVT